MHITEKNTKENNFSMCILSLSKGHNIAGIKQNCMFKFVLGKTDIQFTLKWCQSQYTKYRHVPLYTGLVYNGHQIGAAQFDTPPDGPRHQRAHSG